MKPFFDSQEKLDQLWIEAESWLGTPFFQGSHAKGPGGGVDCINLVQELCLSQGIYQTRVAFPRYRLDQGNHAKESVILNYFKNDPQLKNVFKEITTDQTQPGDIIGFTIGRVVDHLGMMITERHFVHCLDKDQVRIFDINCSFYQARPRGKRKGQKLHTVTLRPVLINVG